MASSAMPFCPLCPQRTCKCAQGLPWAEPSCPLGFPLTMPANKNRQLHIPGKPTSVDQQQYRRSGKGLPGTDYWKSHRPVKTRDTCRWAPPRSTATTSIAEPDALRPSFLKRKKVRHGTEAFFMRRAANAQEAETRREALLRKRPVRLQHKSTAEDLGGAEAGRPSRRRPHAPAFVKVKILLDCRSPKKRRRRYNKDAAETNQTCR